MKFDYAFLHHLNFFVKFLQHLKNLFFCLVIESNHDLKAAAAADAASSKNLKSILSPKIQVTSNDFIAGNGR